MKASSLLRARGLQTAALLVLAVAPFAAGVRGGFIEDDIPIIQSDPDLRERGSLWSAFTRNYWRDVGRGGLYRPVTVFSYGLDRIVWGAEEGTGAPAPYGIHITNLVLHALTTLLVWRVARRVTDSDAGSWVAAAIFATHPVHTEAVVHLVGRADVLVTLFFVAAFLAHDSRSRTWWILAPFLYLGALLSKEMGASLPAVLLVHAWFGRAPRTRLRPFVVEQCRRLWPYVVMFAFYMVVRGRVLGSTLEPPQAFAWYIPGQFVAFENPEFGEVTLTMLHAFGEAMLLMVFPLWLSADYSGFPHHTGLAAPVVASLMALSMVVAGGIWARRKGALEVPSWVIWFFVTLLPVSNLIVISGIIMAERALYLPSVSIAVLAGIGASALARRHPAWLVIPALVIALFGVRSALYTPAWTDALTLFERTEQHGRFRGHIALSGLCGEYLGIMAKDPSREPELLDRALACARESVRGSKNAYNLDYLARLLEKKEVWGESLENWEHLRRYDPTSSFYRAGVERLLQIIISHPENRDDLQYAVRVGVLSIQVAGQRSDPASADYWSRRLLTLLRTWIGSDVLDRPKGQQDLLMAVNAAHHRVTRGPGSADLARAWSSERDRLMGLWIVGAAQRQDWVLAMEGCQVLQRMDADHELLKRHRVTILERVIGFFEGQGNARGAREAARQLRAVDPGNDAARRVLGGS